MCKESREWAICKGSIQGRFFTSVQGKTDLVILRISQLYLMELRQFKNYERSQMLFSFFPFLSTHFCDFLSFPPMLKPSAKKHPYSKMKRTVTFDSSVL